MNKRDKMCAQRHRQQPLCPYLREKVYSRNKKHTNMKRIILSIKDQGTVL